ncbi:hypothetical protein ANRL4_00304 [Anaerolineae bacterium]|nr:hypothetical protein ANRL4_00304 [Anaerolineae bacterium]
MRHAVSLVADYDLVKSAVKLEYNAKVLVTFVPRSRSLRVTIQRSGTADCHLKGP